jgi:hypothetical protein
MRDSSFSYLGLLVLVISVALYSGTAFSDAADETPVLGSSSDTPATDTGEPSDPNAISPTAARAKPVYAAPRRGRPRARVGGAVRSTGTKLPTIRAIVPGHVAHTARSRPTLFWYVSAVPPAEASLMFSLTNEDEIDPLIRAEIERPTRAGLQRIDLSKFDFDLETGTEYEWSVALVPDSESRGRDLVTLGWIERVDAVALGWIERVEGPEALVAAAPDAGALAAAGLWYDAVEAADENERAALLSQVGLAPSSLP